MTIEFTVLANGCNVAFNANGGNVSPQSRTVEYGAVVGGLPVPTRSGYVFDGWYTAASGGTQITESTKVTANDAAKILRKILIVFIKKSPFRKRFWVQLG